MTVRSMIRAPWKIQNYVGYEEALVSESGTHLIYFREAPGLGDKAENVRNILSRSPELLEVIEDLLSATDILKPTDTMSRAQARKLQMQKLAVARDRAIGVLFECRKRPPPKRTHKPPLRLPEEVTAAPGAAL